MDTVTPMQSPSRLRVVAARIILVLGIYVPFAISLHLDGRNWFYSLFAPALWLPLGWGIGSAIAILMMTAAGLPLPWSTGDGT